MVANYKSVFDIIGPIMIGPSSSHTAGAVAIGRAANKVFNGLPEKITVHYYESFAQTHKGHGTDYAIISGILGFNPDDSRVPDAINTAKSKGMTVKFIEEKEDSPINHPNTAIINLQSIDKEITLAGCSIGGGTIEVRGIKMDGFDIKPQGPLPIVLIKGNSTDKKIAEEKLNKLTQIHKFNRYSSSNKQKQMFEYDLSRQLRVDEVAKLSNKLPELIYL
ncbi:L-serine ammonia-lyase, iron-sulfur-dependent subunit beta [Liquorilactobacillus capillatus]|uniref:L-serine dehydratase n=1 Tax=Liquorilactobacillus capillatus DSM 19910 TaxID=1423731 RepID=A0A0R1M642_9LACO|nr:L-serine ammonia-lyase, iron-sulfur-dependent subunit beta [Liquorilactobacillus capillatus]KRL01012.1 l-serine ammonia-lyase beta subunit [Liquorilactobacillus capillatus DSM 19910]